MPDDYVLVASRPPPPAGCYHRPCTPGASRPYCVPTQEYHQISRETAHSLELRLCQRCAQQESPGYNTDSETTCPFCAASVQKASFPDHLQTCSERP